LFTGAPGTGKTTLAEATAERLGAPVLGWDWAMAALTWNEPVQDALRSLDRPTYTKIGWSILWNVAEAQLRLVDTSDDPSVSSVVGQVLASA
jgi:predicted kinase